MGMIITDNNANYFEANIQSWRCIRYVLEQAGFDVPSNWSTNDAAGLGNQTECNRLADKLTRYLTCTDQDEFIMPSSACGESSPCRVDRKRIQEFIDFLYDCEGFEIR